MRQSYKLANVRCCMLSTCSVLYQDGSFTTMHGCNILLRSFGLFCSNWCPCHEALYLQTNQGEHRYHPKS